MVFFDRFDHSKYTKQECNIVQKVLKRYILAIFICKDGGDLLYSFQIDPKFKIDLISQFIAALSMFGESSLGKINKIFIEGLDVEAKIIVSGNLILTTFFRPKMVQDYLGEEAKSALNLFKEKYKVELERGTTNRVLYESFDAEMCDLVRKYLVRLGILEDFC